MSTQKLVSCFFLTHFEHEYIVYLRVRQFPQDHRMATHPWPSYVQDCGLFTTLSCWREEWRPGKKDDSEKWNKNMRESVWWIKNKEKNETGGKTWRWENGSHAREERVKGQHTRCRRKRNDGSEIVSVGDGQNVRKLLVGWRSEATDS